MMMLPLQHVVLWDPEWLRCFLTHSILMSRNTGRYDICYLHFRDMISQEFSFIAASCTCGDVSKRQTAGGILERCPRLRGCWTMLPSEVQGHCIPTERRLGWLLPGIWKLNVTKRVTKTKSFAASSLTSTVPSCRKSLARSKSTDNGWVWRNLFFPIFTEKWRLWWG